MSVGPRTSLRSGKRHEKHCFVRSEFQPRTFHLTKEGNVSRSSQVASLLVRLQSACVDHGRHTHSQEWQGEYTLQSFLVTSLRPPSCTHTLTRTATSLPCSFPMLTRSSTSTDLTFFSTRPDIQRISLWHIVIDAKSNDLAPPTVRRRQ